jgi:Transketolase, C-terminal domain
MDRCGRPRRHDDGACGRDLLQLRPHGAEVPTVFEDGFDFELGKARLVREGRDVGIVTCGIMLATALEAAQELSARGIEAAILHSSTLKPFDDAAVLALAREVPALVTVQNHTVMGGLGSAVAGPGAPGLGAAAEDGRCARCLCRSWPLRIPGSEVWHECAGRHESCRRCIVWPWFCRCARTKYLTDVICESRTRKRTLASTTPSTVAYWPLPGPSFCPGALQGTHA